MKRSRVGLEEIADWNNLAAAFGRAAIGKRGRADVESYRSNLDDELSALRSGLLRGDYPVGHVRRFTIRDPKPRMIHAPCFRERVLHHAVIAKMGPVMDRALVEDVYACRIGKGVHVAVRRVQQHTRRWPWYAQIDIRQYFPNIDHGVLFNLVARKFSDHGLLAFVRRMLCAHEDGPGRGLPIGALTSQNFANLYLAGADRLALEQLKVGGYVRYMDDLIWFGQDRISVRQVLSHMCDFITDDLRLEVKSPVKVGRSRDGVSFCGYRVFPDRLLLSRRRKTRFASARKQAELQFLRGEITEAELQRKMDAALAITSNADARVWRRGQLLHTPLAAALAGV